MDKNSTEDLNNDVLNGFWIAVSGDGDAYWGPFDTRQDAQSFIENATDELIDEPHMWTDDINNAKIIYVNSVVQNDVCDTHGIRHLCDRG